MIDQTIDDQSTVRLPASASVRECAALKRQLVVLVESADVVRIDVADVELIDTAALQLLFAFSRERFSQGRGTIWEGDSPAFRNAAAAVGLQVGDPAGPSTDSTQS